MNQRIQRITLLHLGLALFTIFRAEGASFVALCLSIASLALVHMGWIRGERLSSLPNALRTGILALAVAATIARILISAEFVVPGVDLLLLLIVERFLFRHRLREQMQLLLLSCILMVISGVIHVGLDYPLLLALFSLVAIVHLAFCNIQYEAERLGARAQFQLQSQGAQLAPQLYRRNLWLASMVLSSGLLVFVLFPRIGAGVFLRGSQAQDQQAGFSDEVALGQFGRIKDNHETVARIYLPRDSSLNTSSQLPWYFRASAFDHYHDGRWSHSDEAMKPSLRPSAYRYYLQADPRERLPPNHLRRLPNGGSALSPIPSWATSQQSTSVRIVQEDLGSNHLILLSRPALIELMPRGAMEQRTQLYGDLDEQVKARGKFPGSIQFQVYARIHPPSPAELQAIGRPVYDSSWSNYLDLPATLSPEFFDFAQGLIDPKTRASASQIEIVQSLLRALADYQYTTDLPPPSPPFAHRDPSEAFLLDTRRGHCEYFATSLALLARHYKIPARVVNGYYGAQRNPVGGYYQITQSSAHSWVEIFFEDIGWVVFDATPPDRRSAPWPRNTLIKQLRNLFDALETRYLEYVVDYDGKKQLAALKKINRAWPSLGRFEAGPLLYLLLGLGGLALGFEGWRRRRRCPRETIARALDLLRDDLVKRGLDIPPQQNPLAWARRAATRHPLQRDRLLRLVEQGEQMRFSKSAPSRAQARAFGRAIHRLRQQLRS